MKVSGFLWIYRWIQKALVSPLILPWFFEGERLSVSEFPEKKQTRIWFHAASVGELETLWNPILQAAKNHELVLTVFSSSACSRLRQLADVLTREGMPPVAFGYSPFEGSWEPALASARPDWVVTAKYEAWPDLWASLVRLKIPLAIVGASVRRSLLTAKRFSVRMTGAVPRLYLAAFDQSAQQPLKALFPEAKVTSISDPRWERVLDRSTRSHPRANAILTGIQNQPRPWGVLGSVWKADLKIWQPILAKGKSFWIIVPHQVDPTHLAEVESVLRTSGLKWVRSSQMRADSELGAAIVVDEMGFLSELYAVADWVYVGGGFGAGIHSTIEPAVVGVPIACGPKNVDQFFETHALRSTGQLTVISDSGDLQGWIAQLAHSSPAMGHWKQAALAKGGATQTLLEWLELSGNSC